MMLTWRTAGAMPWRMFSLFRDLGAAPIELLAQRYNFLPTRFRYQGEVHRVARIERMWEDARRGGRRFFAVRCADARRCTLVQELRAGTWHVQW
jgi:hypothetical protein